MCRRHIAVIGLLVSLAVLIPGCLAAAVGVGAVGTVAYIKGDLKVVEAKNIDAVYAATKEAVKHLGLKVTKDSKDALSAEIIARDSVDRKIKIKLQSESAEITKLSIRAGLFGNETRSTLVYQEIHDNLK